MLIVLDDSLKSIVRKDDLTDNQLNALHDIASSVRRGKHALTALSRGVLDALSQSNRLNGPTKALYKKFHSSKWRKHKGLCKVVSRRLLVGIFSESKHLKIQSNGDIPVNLEYLSNSDLLQETILILENPNDEVIYRFIYKSMSHYSRNKYVTSWEFHNGGGSTTEEIYSKIQDRSTSKRMVLCIVDSDKKYPDHEIGKNTASKVIAADNNHNPLSSCYVITAHEAENLIPLFLYHECLKTEDTQYLLDIYNKISDKGKNIFQRYFDYKKGIQCKELNCGTYKKNQQVKNTFKDSFKDYWLSIADVIAPNKLEFDYKECTKPSCDRYIFPELEKQDIQLTCKHLENRRPLKLDCGDPLYNEWNSIANIILDWCFSFPPPRT